MINGIYQSRFAAFKCQYQSSLGFAGEEEWPDQLHHGRGKTSVSWGKQKKYHKQVSLSTPSVQI